MWAAMTVPFSHCRTCAILACSGTTGEEGSYHHQWNVSRIIQNSPQVGHPVIASLPIASHPSLPSPSSSPPSAPPFSPHPTSLRTPYLPISLLPTFLLSSPEPHPDGHEAGCPDSGLLCVFHQGLLVHQRAGGSQGGLHTLL